MNIVKHMLDELHISMTKLLVPQEKKIWGRSQICILSERNDRLTSVGEAEAVALRARATIIYDLESYGI